MAHTCYLSTWEAELGGLPQVQDHPGLPSGIAHPELQCESLSQEERKREKEMTTGDPAELSSEAFNKRVV